MFKKIFTYSDIDRKENRVNGIWHSIIVSILAFPAAGLMLSLFSCYVKYLDQLEYEVLYYTASILLIINICAAVVRWLGELLTVYAVSEDGKIYIFKMTTFAIQYIGIGRKLRDAASKGQGRMALTYELIMNIRKSIQDLQNEQQIEELILQGCAVTVKSIDNISEDKSGITVKCIVDGIKGTLKKSYNIRKVYVDSNNLIKYIKNVNENGYSKSDFTFEEKTKYEDFEVEKDGYLKKVARQTFICLGLTMWIALFMLNSDIAKEAKIRNDIYISTEATVTDVVKKNGVNNNQLSYKKNGKYYKNVLISSKDIYKESDNLKIYINAKKPAKYFVFDNPSHINYKPVAIVFLLAEFIILLANFDINILFRRKKG